MSETVVPKQGMAQLQFSTIKFQPKLKMVNAEVGKPALKLTTACIAVKRTPVYVDVLHTSAKTLWTVRNISKGCNTSLFPVLVVCRKPTWCMLPPTLSGIPLSVKPQSDYVDLKISLQSSKPQSTSLR